ncbi:MAG: SIMPL domain-containing protein [Ideonella sp.]|jgi:predicted secreted protein|nr:SIMPL domain-containing protein [Ideonella sp.]
MTRTPFLAIALMAGAAAAAAQTQILPPPQNVLQLSASATAEVAQDLLAITLSVQREGSDAAAVQSQLKQTLDAALAEARKAARPGQVEVRTGSFGIYPRYAPKGGVNGWQGRADLVLEGRDMAAISQLAGRLSGMVVSNVAYGLARETRERVEGDVAAQAIGRFKARADTYAKQFGFGGYAIREVNVGQADAAFQQGMPRVRAMSASLASDEAVPVEAGKANVTVTVNGSVQMSTR